MLPHRPLVRVAEGAGMSGTDAKRDGGMERPPRLGSQRVGRIGRAGRVERPSVALGTGGGGGGEEAWAVEGGPGVPAGIVSSRAGRVSSPAGRVSSRAGRVAQA